MAEKTERTSAKRIFTRENNSLNNLISNGCYIEICTNSFKRLSEHWNNVLVAHEKYVDTLTDAQNTEIAAADEWIGKVQQEFMKTENAFYGYIHSKDDSNGDKGADTKLQQGRLLNERKLKERKFNNQVDLLDSLLKAEGRASTKDILKEQYDSVKVSYEEVNTVHENYVLSLTDEEAESAFSWIDKAQKAYKDINMRYSKGVHDVVEEVKSTVKTSLKLERMKLPYFNGDVKKYTRFKDDFKKFVLPEVEESKAAYVLRSCLGKETLDFVRNVDDSIGELWKRLDERFGQPSVLTEVIMNEIKRHKALSNADEKGLVEFIDIIESNYRDLTLVGMENEISNLTTISLIEEKLPITIRRKWAEEVSKDGSNVDKRNPFPALLKFLIQQRRAIEYVSSDIRNQPPPPQPPPPKMPLMSKGNTANIPQHGCWIHNSPGHTVSTCSVYLQKSDEQRVAFLKENNACWCCLHLGHRVIECLNKKKCSVEGCEKHHNDTLHGAHIAGVINHAKAIPEGSSMAKVIFQIMSIRTSIPSTSVNVMWDGGSNCSLITFEMAKRLNLTGKPVKLTVQKVGQSKDEAEAINSLVYSLKLLDLNNRCVSFQVYGIQKISNGITPVNFNEINELFSETELSEVKRMEGAVDVLIGLDYAAYHPRILSSNEHLVIASNRFGKCLSGSHKSVSCETESMIAEVAVNHMRGESIEEFINVESLGQMYKAAHRCNTEFSNLTLKEEREMKLIKNGLHFKEDHWEACYPWVMDPYLLPDNRAIAVAILKSTEKRVMKDEANVELYRAAMMDMQERKVARKLSEVEMRQYKGPVHYTTHHEIIKLESESTKCRIVYNTSLNYRGHVLNDYWAKGSSLINNLPGILIRFRENYVGVAGDIEKMYHAIKISLLDQHTHRFLWRDFDLHREPDTFVITCVCFGDKPAGTIAITALRETAKMANEDCKDAKYTIKDNSYVDDLIDSFSSHDVARHITKQIDNILKRGGFKIKLWVMSSSSEENQYTEETRKKECIDESQGSLEGIHKSLDISESTNADIKSQSQKVLGVYWVPNKDRFYFAVRLSLNKNKKKRKVEVMLTLSDIVRGIPMPLTKRIILSWINRLYDPLGLLAPFVIRTKMLMRKLWMNDEKRLGWDDPIPLELKEEWDTFFIHMFEVEEISFQRCIKPLGATEEEPMLVIFVDSSEQAFGCCAYIRWKSKDGSYRSNLLIAKTHVAPMRAITIVQLEVNGARLGSQLKCFIEDESRLKFAKIYLITDSEITLGMIQRDSYKMNTYFGVRIGEIQERTNTKDWYWTSSENNIADWLTRGRSPGELHQDSEWQNGPLYLSLPEADWPVKQSFEILEIPDVIRSVMAVEAQVADSLADRINIEKYSSYLKLIRVTSRILAMYKGAPVPSFRGALVQPTGDDIAKAVMFWIQDAQSSIKEFEKRFANLGPVKDYSGIYRVGQRIEKWVDYTYNEASLILLPGEHQFSYLYALFVHKICHHGVGTTVSKVRLKFWVTNLNRLVKNIVTKCVPCRKNKKQLEEQIMAPLPLERLKPSPPFHNVAVDYFGPFSIRGEVNQRTRGKGYGVLFTCLYTRAVFTDLANNYSTDGFLNVFRRFVSIRGYPRKMYSDNGKQFVGASRELKSVIKGLDWDKIMEFGAEAGLEWKFSPADAPWQNGCVESLVKSIKKAIRSTMGVQVLKFSELQTVFYEASNLVNERPIGKHPTDSAEERYLCPNDLLLGRASSRVPGGPFKEVSGKRRYEFIQKIADTFWRKWTNNYFPSLIIRQKWHTERRNVKVNDIVLVKDSNSVRGNWKLGKVTKTCPSADGKVRRCQVSYKPKVPGVKLAANFIVINRPIQDLVVIVACDEEIS